MAQTSYSINHEESFKGMKVDSRFDYVATGIADGIIGFGLALRRSDDPDYQVAVIEEDTEVFYGIALYEESQTTGNYPVSKPVNVLRSGSAWVEATVAVSAGDAAYVDVANSNFTNVSTGNVPTGGTFTKTIASPGLTKIEINLP